MASGREMQLTKQVGEYLVCAELCRRGLISTSFNGNVPEFDILAICNNNITKRIQVKTINGGNWQLDARRIINVEQRGEEQIISFKELDEDLIYVFVYLVSSGIDEFYIIKADELQSIIFEKYNKYLDGHDRKRKSKSTHAAIDRYDLKNHKDGWGVIT